MFGPFLPGCVVYHFVSKKTQEESSLRSMVLCPNGPYSSLIQFGKAASKR